jgi:hypothetical protein
VPDNDPREEELKAAEEEAKAEVEGHSLEEEEEGEAGMLNFMNGGC